MKFRTSIVALVGTALAVLAAATVNAQSVTDLVIMRRTIAPPNQARPTPAPTTSPTASPTPSRDPITSTCEPVTQGRGGVLSTFDSAKFWPVKGGIPYTQAHTYCSAYEAEYPYKVVSCEWGQTSGVMGTASVGMISRSANSKVTYATRDSRYASGSCTPN
jgi:hypothetical protein